MINLQNVSYIYPNNYLALNNINLQIRAGEFVTILGRNGSGKSTLAHLINGLLVPTNGIVSVDNLDTRIPKNNRVLKQKVGLLFSSPDDQIVSTIVEEDIAFGPENLGLSPNEIRIRVDNALKMVSMEDYRVYPPNLLSGGQKQKISIAGLLAMKPNYLVLDEPTSMLDENSRKDILNILLKLNREEKIGIILITHNTEEALLAQRVLVLDKGQIMLDGLPEEILPRFNELQSYGVEPLEITRIINILNNQGIELDSLIIKIDELVDAICQLK